ncbi:MAG: hypothetical protein HQL50_03935 [Magnetococcales bacterium]|nr:hypothetical protein [Magnetococcales bacterium]
MKSEQKTTTRPKQENIPAKWSTIAMVRVVALMAISTPGDQWREHQAKAA